MSIILDIFEDKDKQLLVWACDETQLYQMKYDDLSDDEQLCAKKLDGTPKCIHNFKF